MTNREALDLATKLAKAAYRDRIKADPGFDMSEDDFVKLLLARSSVQIQRIING